MPVYYSIINLVTIIIVLVWGLVFWFMWGFLGLALAYRAQTMRHVPPEFILHGAIGVTMWFYYLRMLDACVVCWM